MSERKDDSISQMQPSSQRLLGVLQQHFGGPNTIGNSGRFWLVFGLTTLLILIYPFLTNTYVIIVNTDYFIWVILALSLSVVWGYTGIFNFGQTGFFGLGGYAFGVIGINLIDVTGGTNIALIGAILVPVVFSLLLGYFMFYGRVGGLYVAILTLVVTLMINLILVRSTNESIGTAQLGGNNGITGIPELTLGGGGFSLALDPLLLYYFVAIMLLATYLGLRYILNSYYGYVMLAIREDEARTEMFGYNIKKLKLLVFVGSAGLGGFAGGLYAAWGNFIDPTLMSLTLAALPIIWITVGGRDTLIGAALGAYALQSISTTLSTFGSGHTIIFLGSVLIVVILFFPDGIVPAVYQWWYERKEDITLDRLSIQRGD